MDQAQKDEIWRRHNAGEGFSSIAKDMEFSRERVRQIYFLEVRRRHLAEQHARDGAPNFQELDFRARNGLMCMGFPDPHEHPLTVAKMLSSIENPSSLLRSNFGEKTLAKLMRWSETQGFPMKPPR